MTAHPAGTRSTTLPLVLGRGRRWLARTDAYRILLFVALLANVALAAYVAAVILPAVIRIEGAGWQPGAIVDPSPSPSATPALAPMAVAIPADADCSACHAGPGVTKPRPVMAHPLAGWESCTACHAADKLVATAPGHESIHKEDCLACHKAAPSQSAPPKPHHTFNGTSCTVCHGNPAIPQAPLPASMAERTNCWVCHGLTQGDELWTGPVTPSPSIPASPAGTVSGAGSMLYKLVPASSPEIAR